MNNNTNKKKLELRKTAIANLTLSEEQMGMVNGGLVTPTVTESREINGLTDCQNNSKGICIPDEKKTR